METGYNGRYRQRSSSSVAKRYQDINQKILRMNDTKRMSLLVCILKHLRFPSVTNLSQHHTLPPHTVTQCLNDVTNVITEDVGQSVHVMFQLAAQAEPVH